MAKTHKVELRGDFLSVTRDGYGHDHRSRTYEGKVEAVGANVRADIKVGDKIIYRAQESEELTVHYTTTDLIREDAVVGLVREVESE